MISYLLPRIKYPRVVHIFENFKTPEISWASVACSTSMLLLFCTQLSDSLILSLGFVKCVVLLLT